MSKNYLLQRATINMLKYSQTKRLVVTLFRSNTENDWDDLPGGVCINIKEDVNLLPREIGQLTDLEYLNLNTRMNNIPREIGRLKKLKFLKLYCDNHATIIPELSRLSSLEELDIFCYSEKINLRPLLKLKNLRAVRIEGYSIKYFPMELCQLENLTELVIRYGLTTLPPEIKMLKKLKRLELDRTSLTNLPVEITAIDGLWQKGGKLKSAVKKIHRSWCHLFCRNWRISSLSACMVI